MAHYMGEEKPWSTQSMMRICKSSSSLSHQPSRKSNDSRQLPSMFLTKATFLFRARRIINIRRQKCRPEPSCSTTLTGWSLKVSITRPKTLEQLRRFRMDSKPQLIRRASARCSRSRLSREHQTECLTSRRIMFFWPIATTLYTSMWRTQESAKMNQKLKIKTLSLWISKKTRSTSASWRKHTKLYVCKKSAIIWQSPWLKTLSTIKFDSSECNSRQKKTKARA